MKLYKEVSSALHFSDCIKILKNAQLYWKFQWIQGFLTNIFHEFNQWVDAQDGICVVLQRGLCFGWIPVLSDTFNGVL